MSNVPPRAAGSEWEPAYLALHRDGFLDQRVERAWEHLTRCHLCARYCLVNRLETLKGVACKTGEQAVVHSFGPHHGEEDPLRGTRGSGTIFFSWCNLRCVYCQNWEISHQGQSETVSTEALADMMVSLQQQGCHNINLVSPSHVVAQIIAAVAIAARKGLRLPIVYNTGGYDSLEALALLDGVVDIYMPDMKYGDSAEARRHSKVRDYVRTNRAAVKEMHRQVGELVVDDRGVAVRGLLARHLVLPDDVAGTEAVLKFLAEEVSKDTYLNLMAQYFPCYRAGEFPSLDRSLTKREYQHALELAERHGLRRLDRHG